MRRRYNLQSGGYLSPQSVPSGNPANRREPPLEVMGAPMPDPGMKSGIMGRISNVPKPMSPKSYADESRAKGNLRKQAGSVGSFMKPSVGVDPVGMSAQGMPRRGQPMQPPPQAMQRQQVGQGDRWLGELWQDMQSPPLEGGAPGQGVGGFAAGGIVSNLSPGDVPDYFKPLEWVPRAANADYGLSRDAGYERHQFSNLPVSPGGSPSRVDSNFGQAGYPQDRSSVNGTGGSQPNFSEFKDQFSRGEVGARDFTDLRADMARSGYALGGTVAQGEEPVSYYIDLYEREMRRLEESDGGNVLPPGNPGGMEGILGSQALPEQSQNIASKGRFGDNNLLHVSDEELDLMEAMGGPLPTNPKTGNPEAFGFAIPLIASAVSGIASGIASDWSAGPTIMGFASGFGLGALGQGGGGGGEGGGIDSILNLAKDVVPTGGGAPEEEPFSIPEEVERYANSRKDSSGSGISGIVTSQRAPGLSALKKGPMAPPGGGIGPRAKRKRIPPQNLASRNSFEREGNPGIPAAGIGGFA